MISNIGKYFVMLSVIFRRPKKKEIFKTRLFNELVIIGMSSLPIVMLMSAFMGGVIALQTASNITSPLLPAYTIGYITQNSTILEFSPTIISLILAGKVGSNIASEIGTMRVTEQIDALEIMGVNSLSYLVLPKIIFSIIDYFFHGLKYFWGLDFITIVKFMFNRNISFRN
jgi:phospholipid/cholesterol/gamma-HCH transport system permease protein